MTETYRPGTFCVDMHCPKHQDLEALADDAYRDKKRNDCRDCMAWKYFLWLEKHGFKIIKPFNAVPAKELAARLKGIDPARVEHLSIEEILCL